MINNNCKKIFFSIVLLSIFSSLCFSQNEPKPYSDDEFPSYSKDIRRFEIITLGSLPFIVFDSVLVYSGIKWSSNNFEGAFPNPFSAKSGLTKEEMTGVLLTSLGISLCIAITDLIINKVKANKNNSLEQKTILILPEELNPPINNENFKTEDDSLEK